jgi:hypothetical protein
LPPVEDFNRRLLLKLPRLRNGLRWPVLGLAVFILLSSLRQHWAALGQLRPDPDVLSLLLFGLGALLLERLVQGWGWSRLAGALGPPVHPITALQLFLKSRLLRYQAGNFDGQIPLLRWCLSQDLAALPLVAAVQLGTYVIAVLALALLGLADDRWWLEILLVPLAVVLLTPGALQQCLQRGSGDRLRLLSRLQQIPQEETLTLRAYPWLSLVAGVLILLLRTLGFACVLAVVLPLQVGDGWSLLGAVSGATLVGILLPGGPAGLGVFDAMLLLLLGAFPPGAGLVAVLAYRLLWILADTLATALARVDQALDRRFFNRRALKEKTLRTTESQSTNESI